MRTHSSFLINTLLKDFEIKRAVEVGVFKGDNAFALLENLPIEVLYGVDPYMRYPEFDDNLSVKNGVMANADLNVVRKEMLKRMKPFGNRFKHLYLFSADAAYGFDDEYFDFIFLDGNHWYDYVVEDIQVWLPKLKDGGILAGHDYVNKVNCGVIKAVDDTLPFYNSHAKSKVWWYVDAVEPPEDLPDEIKHINGLS